MVAAPGRGNHEPGLVFDPPAIALQRLSEKPLDIGLELLPSLIRCRLIHVSFLLVHGGLERAATH
jgi:hypothetical protein